jgi:serine/threonine protein kinase
MNDWEKVVEIFERAIELAPAERAAFLDRVCLEENVRGEVEAMLAADERADAFIESPAVAAASASLLKNKFSAPETVSPVGTKIGAYRLTREIGRGGMGAVYAAERADGEFKKRVAIKLIRSGTMDSEFIVRRFRRERQILAELNHPFIARLLDGGTTADNLPYLIMEFIEGDTLLEYAEKNRLTVAERLRLFEQICRAVEYAHNQNVLHRDLKPSNILIATDGTPKLLDFGIAKITGAEESNGEYTETALTGKWLMTPEYASPEQVRGEPLTPASDVYSLGVVLYNLITGEAPYKFPSRAPHEISRVICEVAPLRPLSVSGQLLKPESLINARPITNNGRLTTDNRLERIVLKSLRKDSAERYQTAREFAEDIGNYLQREPVAAIDYQNKTSDAEKKSERRRKIWRGFLQIPLGILAVVVVLLMDTVLNLGLPDKVLAFVFTGFLISAIWRVGSAFYQTPNEKLPERRKASAVREALVLRIPLGILATAVVALVDAAFDFRLPDEVPALVFIGFLISAIWRVVRTFSRS